MSKVICLVDDEEDIRAVISTLLVSKGYTVHEAANGLEGMEIIDQHNPDLAILDLMMPGISGLEMCKRLRDSEKFNKLPIIVLSAIAQDSDKPSSYWAAGLQSDDFIRKPFEPLDLLGRVEFLLRRGGYVSHGGKQTKAEGVPESPDVEGAIDAPPPKKSPIAVDSLSPEDVVKTFIESWNNCEFESEYECLGAEMRYNMSRSDYAARRLSTWNESNGVNIKQLFMKSLESAVEGETATVTCHRQNTNASRVENKKETYQLKRTEEGWKIIRVRSQPM